MGREGEGAAGKDWVPLADVNAKPRSSSKRIPSTPYDSPPQNLFNKLLEAGGEHAWTDWEDDIKAAMWGCLWAAAVMALFAVHTFFFQAAPDVGRTSTGAPTVPWKPTVGTTVGATTSSVPWKPVDSGPMEWLMCDNSAQCTGTGTPQFQKWKTSPKSIAAKVSDFSSLPAIPKDAYEPVRQHWTTSPPRFRNKTVRLKDIATFVNGLLASDPFGTGDHVPYVNFRPPGDGKVVAITQRQLAFLVANALMGNSIPTGDGLSAALARCSKKSPAPTGYIYSLLSFLAVLSQELAPGAQGSMLVGATPRAADDSWKQRLASHKLAPPTLCLQGEPCELADFMAGGTPYQAMTDIAGGVVGGGAQLCDIANTQDESVVQFYSEALAFAFFAGGDGAMLPVPWTLLGARRYLSDISGESGSQKTCGRIHSRNWLNGDIVNVTVTVPIGGKNPRIAANAFVAVASVCSACASRDSCEIRHAINNNCESQRRHLDDDIGLWLQAYEPTMYNKAVQDAFRRIVQRIGTGPWGAGAWYGDSQQYFLAVWLATSLLDRIVLDYYSYDSFCENPGNQCFVLGGSDCKRCIAQSRTINASRCGNRSAVDMVSQFSSRPAQLLYKKLSTVHGPPSQVFDLMGKP